MKSFTSFKTLILLTFMALGTAVLFNACKDDDPCDGVECLNGGTCFDGNCDCATGYEGSNCGTEIRAKFIANYSCTNDCFTGISYNQTVTTSSASVTKFLILDMGNEPGLDVVANATGGSSFTIDNQTITDDDGDVWTINGSGALNGTTVNATITYSLLGSSLTCNETWNKQ